MTEECFFKTKYGQDCEGQRDRCSANKGPSRIESIIHASQIYGDGLCDELVEQLASNQNLTIYYHKNCVSRYTSKTNIARYQAVRKSSEDVPVQKRLRHSDKVFDFKSSCLYCGEACEITKDKRNPSRWRPAFMVRSTQSELTQQPYTEYILSKCTERGDKWATDVKARVQGAISDLHAADARYHKDCMSRFFANRNLQSSDLPETAATTRDSSTDLALHEVIKIVSADKNRIWNSIELYKEYEDHNGTVLSRRCLIAELERHFMGDLLVLSSPGVASILTFRSSTAHTLKLVKDDDESDAVQRAITTLSKQVKKDCREIFQDKTCYQTHIDKELAAESVPETIHLLLRAVSPKLDKTLSSILIGNIITSVVNNTATDLQIALGVLLGDSKELISHLHDYRVTCSYDETLRFKKSAAVSAARDLAHQGISDAQSGLVQVVGDNFDADIASPNGKSSTHSLAMIIMQPETRNDDQSQDTIKRLKKTEVSQPLQDEDQPLLVYKGPKQPTMPNVPTRSAPDDFVQLQNVSKQRSDENDFAFIQDIIEQEKCPEFNGYNTRLCREQGHSLKPKTKVVYLPLIDLPPADPSTMLTAMVKAQEISEAVGQDYVVFTCDQQLYRIALQVKWDNPGKFSNVYLRLGGMHLLMSFCGCVGTLMSESGIEEVLAAAFGGVSKMLSGKKYPQNVRALRLLVEELLRPIFQEHSLQSMADLQKILEDVASRSRTSKLWIDCVIKPVLLMLRYIRAERESDWALHLSAVKEMIPFFYAAGHINYARYALYYLLSMQDLPQNIQEQFKNGQHTMHHRTGIFNGIWSDMAIESTFMRYGHSKNGIIGITLKPDTLKTWAYSRHSCHSVLGQLNDMRDSTSSGPQLLHKEESPARIQSDSEDRNNLCQKLELCINPLDPVQHSDGLVNIATGQVINHPAINVDKAVELGRTQMEAFEQNLPGGFYNAIPKIVNTMGSLRKHIKIGETKVINTEAIYARAMGLQNSGREIDTETLMSYELSSVPTSMFNEKGQMRPATTKATLKNALKVETSTRLSEGTVDAMFLDGCAVMWIVPWPSGNSTVQDYIERFRKYIHDQLERADVYLVFDRYIKGSTKEHLRHSRDKAASRTYSLQKKARLPAQNVILTVATNKAQLIDLLVEDLIEHHDHIQTHTLYITGSDPVPIQITHGRVIHRQDMATTQEEADTVIIQQVSRITEGTAFVVADDTDIFLLLLHFCNTKDISCRVFMMSPVSGRAVVDIMATIDKHKEIIPDLLAAHALTGCDTVACSFGIGKTTGLKVLRTGKHKLNMLGDTENTIAPLTGVLDQATGFMLACYGQPKCTSLTEARQKAWTAKVGKKKASAPAISSLPPTNESFKQNVLRAHLQVATWLHALDSHPPTLEPTAYGWTKEDHSDTLTPTTVPNGVAMVPDELLQLIRCSCKSQLPCSSNRCSCKNSGMSCTAFCVCQGRHNCQNSDINAGQSDDDDDE